MQDNKKKQEKQRLNGSDWLAIGLTILAVILFTFIICGVAYGVNELVQEYISG